MPDVVDLVLTCLSVVAVSFAAEISEPLAAACATAPLTSTVGLIIWARKHASGEVESEQLASFGWQIVKGVFASLCFALTFWFCTSNLRQGLWPALFCGYLLWTIVWLSL